MSTAWWFETRGIQRFLADGGRLRDVIGGSELVDWLARWDGGDLLEAALPALGLEGAPSLRFVRRAGGAVAVIGERATLERLRALVGLVVRELAPTLEFNDALGEGEDDIDAVSAARASATIRRNGEAEVIPALGPHLARTPRTGRPVIGWDRSGQEPVDATLEAKRAFADRTELRGRFCERHEDFAWPDDLSGEPETGPGSFPFGGGRRLLAVVHVDGNGLGIRIARLRTAGAGGEVFERFSRTVAAVTVEAARRATAEILLPVAERDPHRRVPARPVLLGGDDLTVILRADLAFAFVRTLVETFERESRARLPAVHPAFEEGMTAAAGIAVVRAGHPYHHAHTLAAALCREAKRAFRPREDGGREISSLAFARIQSTVAADAAELIGHELSFEHDGGRLYATLGAYALDGSCRPAFENLRTLAREVRLAGGAGGLRQVEATLYVDPDAATRAFELWRRNVRERAGSTALARIDGLLADLGCSVQPVGMLPMAGDATPLADITTLIETGAA